MKVFLGGTCNESTWRDEIIPMLNDRQVEYFNPVVDDWTPECFANENRIKEDPDTVNLFVITSQMTGVYSIAELMDCVHMNPKRTVFVVIKEGFDESQLISLYAVGSLVNQRGGYVCRSLTHAAILFQELDWNVKGKG